MNDSAISMLVYIPTYGRPDEALRQVERLHVQRNELADFFAVSIFVSVNGDPTYDVSALYEAGADFVRVLPTNVGGDANYCLGWTVDTQAEYLWILSDDDPIVAHGLECLLQTLWAKPDLVVCARADAAWTVTKPAGVGDLEARGAVIALFSAAIFRRACFLDHAPRIFSAIFSHFAQIEAVVAGIETGTCVNVTGVPMKDVVDYSHADSTIALQSRREVGTLRGDLVYGAVFLGALATSRANFRRIQLEWWKQHWHRASMYRQAHGRYALAADSMARGQLRLLPFYLASVPPWWRLKNLIDFGRRSR